MNIEKICADSQVMLKLDGRLDTITATKLDEACGSDLKAVSLLILDCTKLTYVSSAGLRVLLTAHKSMMGHGRMVVRNVNEEIMEVFDMTGFVDVLNFE